jgi:N-acetylmuramoyl-L-alanine amidase
MSKYNKVVILDPGHGGTEAGAIGVDKVTKEKDLNLAIALKTKQRLLSYGIKCLLTRENDIFRSLAARCAITNDSNAQIFVSIHCNSFPGPNAYGIETFYVSEKGKEIALLVQNRLIEQVDAFNRGVKHAKFYVLVNTKIPAILVECGFMSNFNEFNMLVNDRYQTRLATGIAYGILDCYENQ